MSESSHDILDIVEEPGPDIHEDNLLKTIWLQPRRTFRFIFKHCPDKYLWHLLILGGIASSLGNTAENGFLFDFSEAASIAITALIGGIFGPVANVFVAAILRISSKLMGGKASFGTLITAIAWSLVPTIAGIVIVIFQMGYYGNELFRGELDLSTKFSSIIAGGISILEIALSIWSIIILITGVSEGNGFGIGRAIATVLLPFFILFLIIAFIAFILGDLFS